MARKLTRYTSPIPKIKHIDMETIEQKVQETSKVSTSQRKSLEETASDIFGKKQSPRFLKVHVPKLIIKEPHNNQTVKSEIK